MAYFTEDDASACHIYTNKGSSLKGVSANNHSRFDLPCEGAKNTNGWLHAFT